MVLNSLASGMRKRAPRVLFELACEIRFYFSELESALGFEANRKVPQSDAESSGFKENH